MPRSLWGSGLKCIYAIWKRSLSGMKKDKGSTKISFFSSEQVLSFACWKGGRRGENSPNYPFGNSLTMKSSETKLDSRLCLKLVLLIGFALRWCRTVALGVRADWSSRCADRCQHRKGYWSTDLCYECLIFLIPDRPYSRGPVSSRGILVVV